MPEMISTRTGYGKGMMRLAKEHDDMMNDSESLSTLSRIWMMKEILAASSKD